MLHHKKLWGSIDEDIDCWWKSGALRSECVDDQADLDLQWQCMSEDYFSVKALHLSRKNNYDTNLFRLWHLGKLPGQFRFNCLIIKLWVCFWIFLSLGINIKRLCRPYPLTLPLFLLRTWWLHLKLVSNPLQHIYASIEP